MKKSLIALAVLASSGAAMAQSSVTLYGLLDVWVGSTKTDINSTIVPAANGSTRNTVLNSGGLSTSRIGFKGTEDLGGGLKANFTIETAISPDAPSPSSLGSRVSKVGLSGGFGEINLGRDWTPYDNTRFGANDTFTANISASFNTWLSYEDNPSNLISYTTPSFGGLTGSVAYAFGEDKTAAPGSKASSISAFSLNYAAGPVVAGLAFQQQKQNGTGGVFSAIPGFLIDSAVEAEFDLANGKTSYTLINGSYDFGVVKLVAGYNNVKHVETGVPGSSKANEYNIGLEAPLGANLIIGGGYAQSKLKENGADVAKTTGYSIVAKYALSKRTLAYTALTQTKLKTVPNASDLTVKSNLFAVGVQHTF